MLKDLMMQRRILAGYACCFSAAERAFQLFVEGYALQSGEKKLYENSDEYLKTFSEIININMTVQELIDILSEIEDKSKPVTIDIFDDYVNDVVESEDCVKIFNY